MLQEGMKSTATEWKTALLEQLLPFWANRLRDGRNGGFYGRVLSDGTVVTGADKGSIMHARVLWTFSAAYRRFRNSSHLEAAAHACDFLLRCFWDAEHDGLYWMSDASGQPVERRKHIYNQAFGIYGFAEYFRAGGDQESLDRAIRLFRCIEERARDARFGGYSECFSRDWKREEYSLFISPPELKAIKTMNTHLHLLEAYTNLYRVWKAERLRKRLIELLEIMTERILHPDRDQFQLFFDESWNSQSQTVSFGHDIEGSWLLWKAAEVLQDDEWKDRVRKIAVSMAQRVLSDGLDEDGSLWNEADAERGIITDADKIWWVQAEAMVGFYNAFQLSKDDAYRKAALRVWRYIRSHLIDPVHGEWVWRRTNDAVDRKDPVAGPWKAPYHNGRALLEMLDRTQKNEDG